MNILGCADIHCRNKPEGTGKVYQRLMRTITMKAKTTGCRFVVHAGDLIHEKHAVLVDMLIMLYEEFVFAKTQGVTWVLLPGNHDMPAKDKPLATILHLFRHVAMVYTRPRVLKANGYSIYMNPWRLPEEFKKNSASLAKTARIDTNPFRLQFAHIGLAEGRMSPSNTYRPASPVRVLDLNPGVYSMTLLGDYHFTQQVHSKVWYMGAPIAHMHGDTPNQGVWLINCKTGGCDQINLGGRWPEFVTRNLAEKEVLDLNVLDNYKFRVPAELHAFYEAQVGNRVNVKLEILSPEHSLPPSVRRLEGVNEGDTRKILGIWLERKGYTDADYYELGDEYLNKAERILYEQRA